MLLLLNISEDDLLVSGQRRRLRFAWACLFVGLLFGVACGTSSGSNQSAANPGGFPRTVKSGEAEVSIPQKPERIVSLSPSNDEILCALVDEKRIAGVS